MPRSTPSGGAAPCRSPVSTAGAVAPLPRLAMLDKQIQLGMGHGNVRRWTDVLLPLVEDAADPLGVLDLVTHTVPIGEAPEMYKTFQEKTDGCIKVVITP